MRLESLLLCLLTGTFPAIYTEASDRDCSEPDLRSGSRRNMRAEEDEKAALQEEMNIQKKVIDEMISRKLIIGGAHVDSSISVQNQWPMFALVLMGSNTKLDENDDFCGGALVADNMVITAAHCVVRGSAPEPKYVSLGVVCRSEGLDLHRNLYGDYQPIDIGDIHTSSKPNCGFPIDTIAIDELIPHNDYKNGEKNDIALIKLRRGFDNKGGELRTIQLDYQNFLNGKGSDQNLWVYGFGDTLKSKKKTKYADIGKELRLPYMSRDTCDAKYKDTYQQMMPDGVYDEDDLSLEKNIICGQNSAETGICDNDSGGPVVVMRPGEDLLVGVVSRSGSARVPCAHPGFPDIYTSVYLTYEDFIKPTVCKHTYVTDSDNNVLHDYGPEYMACTCAHVKSCMSGHTGMFKVSHHLTEDDQNQQERNQLRQGSKKKKEQSSIEVTELKDLDIGDFIQGFDEQLQPATCKVEAIGQFGYGTLYGNFTHDHFIYNPTTKMMEEHGIIVRDETEITTEDKYDILTDCPLGVDESGNKFASIDSGFCGNQEELSWSDYILLHRAILRVVRESGPFWFSGSTYPDDYLLGEHSPKICETMLLCMKDHDNCHHFEQASVHFIENVLSSSARDKALRAFKNVGRHRELGSVAAVISDGKSVRG